MQLLLGWAECVSSTSFMIQNGTKVKLLNILRKLHSVEENKIRILLKGDCSSMDGKLS